MLKIEMVWRYILSHAYEFKKLTFTQQDIAQNLKLSTSTVFQSLKNPRRMGAIAVTGRNFSLIDFEKLLLYWATVRNLQKDVMYETSVKSDVFSIEGSMPPDIVFTAYSGFRMLFNDVPSDYDHVYLYAGDTSEIEKRFPKNKGIINLTVLSSDPFLPSFGSIAPPVQIFADLWNLKEWYAKDFRDALKQKLLEKLGG